MENLKKGKIGHRNRENEIYYKRLKDYKIFKKNIYLS